MKVKLLLAEVLALVLATVLVMGCTTSGPVATPPPPSPPEESEYLIQAGDNLDIKFPFNPEMNENITVRPDGRIALPLIEEVMAASTTPAALGQSITNRYRKTLKRPEATVLVKGFAGQKVFVGGEVNTPGLITMPGKITVLQALFQAGGVKNTAAMDSVVVLRDSGEAAPQFFTIKLGDTMLHGAGDMVLTPYDVVFVPKSTIARLNQFVEQYIDKLLPVSRSLGFSYVYNLNPDVVK